MCKVQCRRTMALMILKPLQNKLHRLSIGPNFATVLFSRGTHEQTLGSAYMPSSAISSFQQRNTQDSSCVLFITLNSFLCYAKSWMLEIYLGHRFITHKEELLWFLLLVHEKSQNGPFRVEGEVSWVLLNKLQSWCCLICSCDQSSRTHNTPRDGNW